MAEIWKSISGYESLYDVSDEGRVRSLPRFRNKGRILSQGKIVGGYKIVALYKNDNRKMFRVHRLVAQEFIRKLKENEQVNHIDFNTGNNHVSNLEICTSVENMIHFYKNKGKLKLTHDDVEKIIYLVRDKKMTQCEVAKLYGIYQANVSNYVSGKRRKYIY